MRHSTLCFALVAGCATEAGPSAHVLYVNGCQPDGCMLMPGDDDARTQHSSIVASASYLTAFSWDEATWQGLVTCLRAKFAPFDLAITTDDPGDAQHFELIVAGDPVDIGLARAAGAAPNECPSMIPDNTIAFAFAAGDPNVDQLCWSGAHEVGHLFGLDHELDVDDPMSYLGTADEKVSFQDDDVACGESDPRPCNCTDATQNSYRHLIEVLGPSIR